MKSKQIGCIPIIINEELIGMFTQKDFNKSLVKILLMDSRNCENFEKKLTVERFLGTIRAMKNHLQ
jgi:predicted transcriptional regulator